MKDFITKDEWSIIEAKHHPEHNEIVESLCSIGNGHMGQRANFEEYYSGKTLQGSYVGGVYYPDKTRVGWWKNGYPEYFAKVLNAVNWIGLDIRINEEVLDINACTVNSFERKLNMKTGLLHRTMNVTNGQGVMLDITSERFVSMDNEEVGAIKYTIKSSNSDINLALSSYLDTDVSNRDSNYDESFWLAEHNDADANHIYLSARTKKTEFVVATAANTRVTVGEVVHNSLGFSSESMHASHHFEVEAEIGQQITIHKYVVLASSRNYEVDKLNAHVTSSLEKVTTLGYNVLLSAHIAKWASIWSWCDVQIKGDIAAQQGIRFNIFHLLQTYTGKDSRLNIGPKGFTGEKYGGSTYWDTEAYCLPFYLATTGADVARNLLIYRHNQLGKAIENATKLGFSKGAALYPMVTMNGEECHNEWEITFEEIHRNGAIAYAIYDYINYTADHTYLASHGLEVLIAISRFWAQRVSYSNNKQAYVMLGVTGPNEYENNVNNNWYTNYIAKWCLEYTTACIEEVKTSTSAEWSRIASLIDWKEEELTSWSKISSNIYLPKDESQGIKLQQEGYLDKEQVLVADLPASERPINQKWSWDRILRSCFIKQADVLQGMYFFEDHFSEEEHMANFDYYEPRTVHESSLSPCVHAILAAKLNKPEKAYKMYLRTSRLDLDDYNNDTEDGLHITSMAGTWLTIVKGFAGMRVRDGVIHLQPMLPAQWHGLSFNILFRANVLKVEITKDGVAIHNEKGNDIDIIINNAKFTATKESVLVTKLELV